jgi:hypothetical protein
MRVHKCRESFGSDLVDQLAELNLSNQFDSGDSRWSELVNVVSEMLDLSDSGYSQSDRSLSRRLNRLHRLSLVETLRTMQNRIDDKIRELKGIQDKLHNLEALAKEIDKQLV